MISFLNTHLSNLLVEVSCIFGCFKVLFAHANPKTIPQAMKVVRKIVKEKQGVPKKLIDEVDDLCQEVIENAGEEFHLTL